MLLQIEEPEDHTPERPSCVVGIDLGTTHCVVAHVKDGKPHTLALDGNALTPSKVTLEGRTFSSIKRYFDGPDIPFEDTKETPITLSTRLLSFLKREAENVLGTSIDGAVITVPAYFDEPARQATKLAAEMSGISVLRLINEPTAAAVAYHLEHENEGIYLVYDLGGGTFDVSLLNLCGGVFQVLGVGGDTRLGGDDVDQLIVEFMEKQGVAIDLITARHIKESFSDATKTIPKNANDPTLSGEDFTALITPLIQKTLTLCKRVLRDAEVNIEDLKGLILVGGSTRLLGLKAHLTTFFKQSPLCNINADEVVAHGAALQAHGLTFGSDRLLLDVNPISLGIGTMGGVFEVIIPRNTPLPCHMAQNFTTHVDLQTRLDIHIFQGEGEVINDCRSLGQFIFEGIPPMPHGTARIRIAFKMDVDGLLSVEARELSSNTVQLLEIKAAPFG